MALALFMEVLHFGHGVTSAAAGVGFTFSGQGTSTITSNGVAFGCPITIDCGTGTVQLADALELNSTRTLTLTSGTFDAVSYNVTTGTFTTSGAGQTTLKMGSGTWTLAGTGSVWNNNGGTLYKAPQTSYCLTPAHLLELFGANQSYNKLTIGGATGTSTLTISGNNQFTELASTKTVAHTIALGTTTQTFGKWSVTGTAGNVVTLTGTGTSHSLLALAQTALTTLQWAASALVPTLLPSSMLGPTALPQAHPLRPPI
jgi:hypothetical protein